MASSALEGWRRVHIATVFLNLWSFLAALAGALLINALTQVRAGTQFLTEHVGWIAVAVSIAAIPVVFAPVWAATLPWWKARSYRLQGGQVEIRRGIVSRQNRTARFDRIQAVDIVEPLIARIFGLASVRIETAGGGDSELAVSFLRRADAEALRDEILTETRGYGTAIAAACAHGAMEAASSDRGGDAACAVMGTPIPDAADSARDDRAQPARVLIPEIPIARSIVSSILHPAVIIAAVLAVGAAVFPVAATGILPAIVGVVPWLYAVVNRSWRYAASIEDGALSMGYGLAERRRQTVPLDRIHAVQIHQPILWRLTGWWSVRVDIAGYKEDPNGMSTVVLPVGSLVDALEVFAAIGPLDATEVAHLARPEGMSRPDFTSPQHALLASPIDLLRQGVTLVGDGHSVPYAIVTHSGRFARRVSAIDPAHIQELTVRRGPVQNALGIATVGFDLVPGPVHMAGEDLLPTEAGRLLAILRARRLPAFTPSPARGERD